MIPGPIRRPLATVVRKAYYNQIEVVNEVLGKGQSLCTVVIPYFNRGDTISETIDSLKSQTLTYFSVIIVDDGSSDLGSIKMLQKIEKDNPEYIIIRQRNNGVASARNAAIKIAKSRYIIGLDSDDILEPTYLEKTICLLEVNPQLSLATTDMRLFGINDEVYKQSEYDPMKLITSNMVITSAMYRRDAWKAVGGYTKQIGYEDWEFWIKLAEHGFWGKRIPEPIFRYRTAASSRYIDDKSRHQLNVATIQSLHKNYTENVRRLIRERKRNVYKTISDSMFTNLNSKQMYRSAANKGPSVLIAIPWMTFGGAETLLLNFANQIKDTFNISFVTGLDSLHEWEYKFQDITPNIYHLNNLFSDKSAYLEFISNYVKTREIDILHIVHTDFVFDFLGELKKRHPNLKVIVTMFNDHVSHFGKSVEAQDYIDLYTSDNNKVIKHYEQIVTAPLGAKVMPNGIDEDGAFNIAHYNRQAERDALRIAPDETAVFFVGRLSKEKNPDVFVDAAIRVLQETTKAKFFIIGDGPMQQQVLGQINAAKTDNIQYLGYQTDVARLLSAADVFALTSSTEGFPNSLLEAMAMELVVVASDVGAIPDVIENGTDGFVISPGSADEAAKAILSVVNDPQLLNSMKEKISRKLRSDYTNKKLGESYTKMYKELL